MSALGAVTAPSGRTKVRSYKVPKPSPGTALLQVIASGVCGTDIAMARDGRLQKSTILGHHVVGKIARVGEDASKRWGVDVEDMVAVQEYLPCHACRWCQQREYRMCDRSDILQNGRRIGTIAVDEPPALWGGNAQFLHLPQEALVHRLPPGLDAARAVWLLPLANAYDWTVQTGQLQAGDTVLVVGPGQHGLSCVVAAKESDADQVIVVGRAGDDDRLATASKLGADVTIIADIVGRPQELIDRFRGEQIDVVINTSGAGPALVPTLLALAGKRGVVVEAGLASGTAPPLDMSLLTSRAVTLVGSRGRSMAAVDKAIASLSGAPEQHALEAVNTTVVGLDGIDKLLAPEVSGALPPPIHMVVRPWL